MKQKKLIILYLVGMWLCSNNAFANWKRNWLAGASAEYAQRRGDLTISLKYPSFPILLPETVATDEYNDKGMVWGVLGGYQATCRSWLLGIELALNWHDIDHQREFVFADATAFPNYFQGLNLSWGVKGRYQRGPGIELSGRFGYEMAPYFLAYMRLGMQGGKETLDVEINGDLFGITPIIDMHESRWRYRWVVGVGAETPFFCTPVSLRLEYNFLARPAALTSHAVEPIPILDPTFTSFMHPKENALKFSLIWNFR